jgi:glucokinase
VIASARDEAGVAIGVDIGGTKVFGVVLGRDGNVLAEARQATPQPEEGLGGADGPGSGEEVADTVAVVVASLLGGLARRGDRPVTVGVGAPGMVDRAGVLRFAPNLPAAAGADLRSMLQARLPSSRVVVENDANCAAVAEQRFGALQGVLEGWMVTLGTGIGGGLIVGGEVRVGASGFAGEIGHVIVDPNGPPCPCGRRGCWERYASGGGLGRLAREAAYGGRLPHVVTGVGGDPENVHGEDITRAARSGDDGALAVLEELGWWVALGLANLVAVSDPERVVIGGGLAEAGELLLGPTRRAFAALVEGAGVRPDIEIVAAALGERAGAVGAALVAGSVGGG